jgi:hypothetical protein
MAPQSRDPAAPSDLQCSWIYLAREFQPVKNQF